MKITKETILKTLNSLSMPTWIKRIFNMIIEYTSDIGNLIANKADLIDGKVPASQLPSYVDDVIEFNSIQAPDTQISVIVGNNSYKNQIRFINGSSTSSNRVGSADKYPNMFVDFGENTSEDDWTIITPEMGKIYVSTYNNHSYRWSGSTLVDLDKQFSDNIAAISNTVNNLDKNALRTNYQTLTKSQIQQTFNNLGCKVYVTDSSFLESTLSENKIEVIAASKALLFIDTGDLFLLGTLDSTKVTFTRIKSNNIVDIITVTKSTGSVSLLNSYNFRDNEALRFVTQSPALTSAQQDIALSNIGLDFIHVDYSLLGTTFTDSQEESIINSKGIILTNVPENFEKPIIYLRGFNGLSLCRFFALENETIVYINYNKLNHILSSLLNIDLHFDSVRYNIIQTLTNSQKKQARNNIGAASTSDVYDKYKEHGGSKMSESLMYDELAAQLTETTVLIDSIQLDTILDQSLGNKVHNASTILLLNKGEISHFFKGQNINSGYVTFYNLYSGDTATCVIRSLSYEINTRKLLNITTINISPKDYFDKIKNTNPTEDFDKIYKYLFNNTFIINEELLNTTIIDTNIQNDINKASILVIKYTDSTKTPIILTRSFSNNNNNYIVFCKCNDGNAVGAIEMIKIIYNISTKSLSNIQYVTVRNPYRTYNANGGTKYTTEADFNAQFVKVMDMTIAE